MELTSVYQTQIFLYSCIFGLVLGTYYDIFRILKILKFIKKKMYFILDIIFMVTAGIFTFLFLVAVNYGELRIYVLAGEAIGFCLYNFTVSKVIINIIKYILKFSERLFDNMRNKMIVPIESNLKEQFMRLRYKLNYSERKSNKGS